MATPSLLRRGAVSEFYMDQCTRGALRPRSDQEPVEPKISIAIRTSLTDPPTKQFIPPVCAQILAN
jgi:hypothetical protein